LEGLSFTEIGQLFGISPQAAKQTFDRGVRRCRESLAPTALKCSPRRPGPSWSVRTKVPRGVRVASRVHTVRPPYPRAPSITARRDGATL
jgi:hypothetical protein